MKIGLYARLLKDENVVFLQQLVDHLHEHDVQLVVYKDFYEQLTDRIHFKGDVAMFTQSDNTISTLDYLFSIGGDGTILNGVSLLKTNAIPVLGFNTGRLGFLANATKEDIGSVINDLKSKNYTIDERMLLELHTNKPVLEDFPYALNEFTLHKRDASSMITIHVYVEDEFLNSYFADGIIVSTPTGSTAYSLSCGGPIIDPKSKTIVITPVAPHNLNVRSIVIPDDRKLSFRVETRSDHFLCTLDSRFQSIDESYELAVKKANFSAKLVRLHQNSFFSTIREKLLWGVDARH